MEENVDEEDDDEERLDDVDVVFFREPESFLGSFRGL